MEAEPAAEISDEEPEEAEEAPRWITLSPNRSPKVNAPQRHRIVRRHSDSDSNSDSDMKKSASAPGLRSRSPLLQLIASWARTSNPLLWVARQMTNLTRTFRSLLSSQVHVPLRRQRHVPKVYKFIFANNYFDLL